MLGKSLQPMTPSSHSKYPHRCFFFRLKYEIEVTSTFHHGNESPTKYHATLHMPVSVGIIADSTEPDQSRDIAPQDRILRTHHIMVSTPQMLLVMDLFLWEETSASI